MLSIICRTMQVSEIAPELQKTTSGRCSQNVTPNGIVYEQVQYTFKIPNQMKAFFVQVVMWYEGNNFKMVCQQSPDMTLYEACSGLSSDNPMMILPMPEGTINERVEWIKSKIKDLSRKGDLKV
jgi:hypothetical protein